MATRRKTKVVEDQGETPAAPAPETDAPEIQQDRPGDAPADEAQAPAERTAPAQPDRVEAAGHITDQALVDMFAGVLEYSPSNPTLIRWRDGAMLKNTLVEFGGPGMVTAWSLYTAHRVPDVGRFLGLIGAVRPAMNTLRTVTLLDMT